jgi:hypothetical protein
MQDDLMADQKAIDQKMTRLGPDLFVNPGTVGACQALRH